MSANSILSEGGSKYLRNKDGRYMCPHCDTKKTWAKPSGVYYHVNSQHTEEKKSDYTCSVCKYVCFQKQTLDNHMKTRHQDYLKEQGKKVTKINCPFDDCNFSALTKGNCIIHCLRIHFKDEVNKIMDIDEETKAITCVECDREYPSSCAFYYHCKNCINIDKNSEKYELFQSITA